MTTSVRTIAWCCALAAGTAAALYFATVPEQGPSSAAGHDGDHGAQRRLVPLPMEEVTGITIVYGGEARQFLRDTQARWYLHVRGQDHGRGHDHHSKSTAGDGGEHAHVSDPELAERIDKAFAMLGVARIERIVDSGRVDNRFGAADPEMLIMLYRAGEPRPIRRILVGDVAPDSLGRYVLLQEARSMVIIPNYQILNLSALLAFVDPTVPKHSLRGRSTATD